MDARPLVSVIVPSLNGREFLAECLPGLRAQSFPHDHFEVVVVDNGSTDGTAEWLVAEYPEVVLVRLPENLGFSEGINRGAAMATGELLVFLNNDTVAESRFLEELVSAAMGPDLPDCVAARILNWAGDEIEFGGASLSIFGFGSTNSSWHRRFSEAKAGDSLPFACGGAMLVRAKVFECVGGFDPDYFAYYEDVDLGWRLWLSGRRVVYAPRAEVRHRGHATSQRFSSTWRHFHWYRNALLTLIKNSDQEVLPRLLPFAFATFFQRIGALYQSAARASADGEVERAHDLLESAIGAADGIGWILGNVEGLWEKRRRIQALRCVPDRDLTDNLNIRLDFGAEVDSSENARVLSLLPFMDLSALMTPDRAEAAAMAAASRIAHDAVVAMEQVHPELVAWHTEANRLGGELHERNLDLDHARRELHARNLELSDLHGQLHSHRLQLIQLQSELHTGNLALRALHGQLDSRNSEVQALQGRLHSSSLEVQALQGRLHSSSLEVQALHGRLHSSNLAVEETRGLLRDQQERLAAILSSRSWRWTAPLRRLFRAPTSKPRR